MASPVALVAGLVVGNIFAHFRAQTCATPWLHQLKRDDPVRRVGDCTMKIEGDRSKRKRCFVDVQKEELEVPRSSAKTNFQTLAKRPELGMTNSVEKRRLS